MDLCYRFFIIYNIVLLKGLIIHLFLTASDKFPMPFKKHTIYERLIHDNYKRQFHCLTSIRFVAERGRGHTFKKVSLTLIGKPWVQIIIAKGQDRLYRKMGSGCCSVGKAVTFNTRDPRFDSSHWQNLYLNICLFTCFLSTVFERRK